MDMDERAERARQFADEHDMTPEQALGMLLDKAAMGGDSSASGEAQSCAQAMTVGELKRRLINADVPNDAPVNISMDFKGNDPFTGKKVACAVCRHYPISGVSFAVRQTTPELDEDGEIDWNHPWDDEEPTYSSVSIHCHEDVRDVDFAREASSLEVPNWFPEYMHSSDHVVIDEE